MGTFPHSIVSPLVFCAALAGTAACQQQEAPAAKAGQEIDWAIDKASQKIDKAADKIAAQIDKAADRPSPAPSSAAAPSRPRPQRPDPLNGRAGCSGPPEHEWLSIGCSSRRRLSARIWFTLTFFLRQGLVECRSLR